MRLLVLGGTKFLGRHVVSSALARGHEITLFNRGRTNPDIFPEVEHLRGDRDGGLGALAARRGRTSGGRTWDAVVDTCGFVPRVVRDSATLLQDAVDRYVFISTMSVYADTSAVGADETLAVGTLADPTVEDVTQETYGPLKALCEREVERALPGRTLIVRPGLIVGPDDPTDRFTYWPWRVAQGGDVLAAAVDAGLTFRALEDTIAATLDWAKDRGADGRLSAGLSLDREAELLRAWWSRPGRDEPQSPLATGSAGSRPHSSHDPS